MSLHCSFYSETDGECPVRVDRRWDMLNFLFTIGMRSDEGIPAFVTCDWEEISGEAHRIPADKVAEIADFLETRPEASVLENFDPSAMFKAKVYDADLLNPHADEYRAELSSDICALRAFFRSARDKGETVVRVIA